MFQPTHDSAIARVVSEMSNEVGLLFLAQLSTYLTTQLGVSLLFESGNIVLPKHNGQRHAQPQDGVVYDIAICDGSYLQKASGQIVHVLCRRLVLNRAI